VPGTRRVTLLGLIAATYFMVAGGPYGLEDLVQGAGYLWAVVALLVVPFVWSLPTALMVSELSSSLPEEGGYYVWVRRALGPFWGFQEAWLSLAASIFDMAIYPILFVTYLGFVGQYAWPGLGDFWGTLADASKGEKGAEAILIGLAMIAVCALLNLRPPREIGRSSVWLTVALLAPFGVVTVLAVVQPPAPAAERHSPSQPDYVVALLFALWNYMGWDNASTIAGEVERPQRTYPLAMAVAAALVTLTYLVPVLAASRTALGADDWKTGAWVTVGKEVGGTVLAIAVGVGGMISAFGMFNSLVLSYSRVPVVLAEDGYLPAAFTRRLRSGAPWVAVLVCAVAWGLAMQLGLKRVLALDVMVYGLSLLLEFVALVALRIREPRLPRPFRVPGGVVGAALLGLFPALLIGLAVHDQAGKWVPEEDDPIAPAAALLLGAGLAALGPVVYFAARRLASKPGAHTLQGSTAVSEPRVHTMSPQIITVGHSPDPDDAFMFYALAHDKLDTGGLRFRHELQDIETLNRRALRGELEVTAVSIHAYAFLADRYALLPTGCSMGDRYGPMVVARAPMTVEQLPTARLAVPGTLTTAFLALRLLVPGTLRYEVVPFDQVLGAVAEGRFDAGLIIHEGQLTFQNQGLQLVTDLGVWWQERTGLPLPLGGNAVRRDLGAETIGQISRLVKESIRYGLDHRDEALDYALKYARDMNKALADRFVGMYVNDWTLDYGPRGRAAVQQLLDEGHKAGIIPTPVAVEFVS
jgi:1,4-dihydroxy-6-naphthoate synthase